MDVQSNIEAIRATCKFDFVKIVFATKEFAPNNKKQVYATGNRSDRYMRIVVKKRNCLAGLVFKTGRPHFIINIDEELTNDELIYYPIVIAEKLKSIGAVPIISDDKVIAVVAAGFRSANKMTDDVIECFQQQVTRTFHTLFTMELI